MKGRPVVLVRSVVAVTTSPIFYRVAKIVKISLKTQLYYTFVTHAKRWRVVADRLSTRNYQTATYLYIEQLICSYSRRGDYVWHTETCLHCKTSSGKVCFTSDGFRWRSVRLRGSTRMLHTATTVFTARCTLVQSAVLRSHVVCLSVRLSVCLSVCL